MSDSLQTSAFFTNPILNSPYEPPDRHWQLDEDRRPTGTITDGRRPPSYIAPVPKPRKQRGPQTGPNLGVGDATTDEQWDPVPIIAEIRRHLSHWRVQPVDRCGVSPITARLLNHWRNHNFQQIRPFFCQIEAVETAIWLLEVVGVTRRRGAGAYNSIFNFLHGANQSADSKVLRIALKLATGSGKTTVMAMLIAWQALNAIRHPNGRQFTRGFLLVTPGITIRDRLRVLQPNDPDNYYSKHELIPRDMLRDLNQAKIVITNFHAFQRRERNVVSRGGRVLLEGHDKNTLTLETEGQMLQRACGELMSLRNVLVLNDEAHHCYREKPGESEETPTGDKAEAKKNADAARLWMSGLETVQRKLGTLTVFDLSATPFFLSGSGYAEGTLFPWTMSDFSLLDAIECGIVKLPRVPVADNIPSENVPVYREIWKHIGAKMPKQRLRKTADLDPLVLPNVLQTAIDALYSHYSKVFDAWRLADIELPPVFIIVCNNTATSKLLYDYIAGFERPNGEVPHLGALPLFRNYEDSGKRLSRPRTLLIDSEQLESGDALDANFRAAAADEIERFRRELRERTRDATAGTHLTDAQLLREAMNTVGKVGSLGESIRCVVSVAMLSEGWDANTVTHVLGIRAFSTQLLCEQVVGRGLRRQSYELNSDGRFDVEYADILGIPFDFTAEAVVVSPPKPQPKVHVHAVRPARDHLTIEFPRVEGYSYTLPNERLDATFNKDSSLELTPEMVGPTQTNNEGILGEGIVLTPTRMCNVRSATLAFHLAKHLLYKHFRGAYSMPELHLFGDLQRITREWLDGGFLICAGNTSPTQLLYATVADEACTRIHAAIVRSSSNSHVRAILDTYNPRGSTVEVDFTTIKESRWRTHHEKCHLNWAICDSSWEREFCRVVENHPRVLSYVKNHSLGFEVPYRMEAQSKRYIPDFIVRVDDGGEQPLNLIVEVKGFRGEDAKIKAETVKTFWIPGVNGLDDFGRWDFVELLNANDMEQDLMHWFATQSTSAEVRAAHGLALAGGSEPGLDYIPRRRGDITE